MEQLNFPIVIDPGHGGYDPGAVGNGMHEEDITLDVGLKLRGLLERDGRFPVLMTRDRDAAPGGLEWNTPAELAKRCQIANERGAKFFVSIHENAAANLEANGVETLVFDLNSQAAVKAGQFFCDGMAHEFGMRNRGVKAVGHDVYVLANTSMQAVLFEGGFITNRGDAAHMDEYLERMKTAWIMYVAILKGNGFEPIWALDPWLPYKIPSKWKPPVEVQPDYVGHWAEKFIKSVMEAGLMVGTGGGNFEPDRPMTRAEMAVVLYKLNNK